MLLSLLRGDISGHTNNGEALREVMQFLVVNEQMTDINDGLLPLSRSHSGFFIFRT